MWDVECLDMYSKISVSDEMFVHSPRGRKEDWEEKLSGSGHELESNLKVEMQYGIEIQCF